MHMRGKISLPICLPCNNPRPANKPTTLANTSAWLSTSVNLRVREIVE